MPCTGQTHRNTRQETILMTLPGKKAAYWLQLISYFCLIFFITAWITLLVPPQTFPVALVLICCVVPLLLPMMGVLHGKDKSVNWAGYLSLLYFIHGTVEAFANPATRMLGMIEIVISLSVFFSGSLYIRRLSKH